MIEPVKLQVAINTAHAHCMPDNQRYTHARVCAHALSLTVSLSHRIYNTAFPLQQCLYERASVLRCTFIARLLSSLRRMMSVKFVGCRPKLVCVHKVILLRFIIVPLKWWKRAKQLGTTLTNQHSVEGEIKSRLKSGNACYNSVQNLLSSSLLSKNLKIKIYRTIVLLVLLYGCET